jgi:hypothetical protein
MREGNHVIMLRVRHVANGLSLVVGQRGWSFTLEPDGLWGVLTLQFEQGRGEQSYNQALQQGPCCKAEQHTLVEKI